MARDIVKDSQKVTGLRPDHRFMVGDPKTGEILYAEPDQLTEAGVGGADEGPVFSDDLEFDI